MSVLLEKIIKLKPSGYFMPQFFRENNLGQNSQNLFRQICKNFFTLICSNDGIYHSKQIL